MLHRRLGVSVPALLLAGSGLGDGDHCGAVARPERRADVANWLRDTAGHSLRSASNRATASRPRARVSSSGPRARVSLRGTEAYK
jgi:hypothetical protein